jgi:hypothetical protein
MKKRYFGSNGRGSNRPQRTRASTMVSAPAAAPVRSTKAQTDLRQNISSAQNARDVQCTSVPGIDFSTWESLPSDERGTIYMTATSKGQMCALRSYEGLLKTDDEADRTSCVEFNGFEPILGCQIPYYFNQIKDRWYTGDKFLTLRGYDDLSSSEKSVVDVWFEDFGKAMAGSHLPYPIAAGGVERFGSRGELRLHPKTKTDARFSDSLAIFLTGVYIQKRYPRASRTSDRSWSDTELLDAVWYIDDARWSQKRKFVSFTPLMRLLPWNRLGSRMTPMGDSGGGRASHIMQTDIPKNMVYLNAHAQDIAFLNYFEDMEQGVNPIYIFDPFADYQAVYAQYEGSYFQADDPFKGAGAIKAELERIMPAGEPMGGLPKWKYLQSKYAWRKEGKFRIPFFDYMAVYEQSNLEDLLPAYEDTAKRGELEALVTRTRNYYLGQWKKYTGGSIGSVAGQPVTAATWRFGRKVEQMDKDLFYAIMTEKLLRERDKIEKATAVSILQPWYDTYLKSEKAGDFNRLQELQQETLMPAVDAELVQSLTENIEEVEDEKSAARLPWIVFGVSTAALGGAYWWLNRGKGE